MQFSIKMPVKPHLEKFLLYYYTNPIKVSRDDMLGIFLIGLLEKNHNPQPGHWQRPKNEITFMIDEFHAIRSGFEVTPYNFSLFNNWIDAQFRFMLYSRIEDKLEGQPPPIGFYKREIEKFRTKFGIGEDDISIDAMVKDLYRERQKQIKMKRNLGNNCPFEVRRFDKGWRNK